MAALGEVAAEGGFEGRGLFVGAEGFGEVRLGAIAVAVVGVLDVGVISSLALYRSGEMAEAARDIAGGRGDAGGDASAARVEVVAEGVAVGVGVRRDGAAADGAGDAGKAVA